MNIIKNRVGIINYGVGNIKSLSNAVKALGHEPVLTTSNSELKNCSCVILPGVGAFAHVMEKFKQYDVHQIINECLSDEKPCLGVCVGHQLFFRESCEFQNTEGLNIFEGSVRSLNDLAREQKKPHPLRLPNVNWLPIHQIRSKSTTILKILLEGITSETSFYFVHSFAASIHGRDNYYKSSFGGVEFSSISAKGNFVGVQFHPEKSGKNGLSLLNNFIKASVMNEK